MTDSAVSTASVARAVTRRGERWGLSAQAMTKPDGSVAVKACDEVFECEVKGGIGFVRKAKRPLCTVDDEHPFSAVLFNRVDNGETDLARRYKKADADDKAAQQRKIDAYDAETKRIWRSRKRATFFTGGGYSPAGLAARGGTGRAPT